MSWIGIVCCTCVPIIILACGLNWSRRLSHRSGWGVLAARYPAGRNSGGRHVDLATARLNQVWYRHHVEARFTCGGVRLSLPPLLKLSHPAMLIPWDDIEVIDGNSDDSALDLLVLSQAKIRLVGELADAARQAMLRFQRC